MRSGLHDSDAWSLYSVLHSLKCELKLLVFNGIHVIIDSELAMKNSCLWDKTRGDKNFIHTTHRKKDIKNDKSTYEALPGWGCPMSPVRILKRLVSVFINACHLLSALPPLSQFAEGGCLLSRFHFMRCRYFLDHVACRNLPWQGLTYARYKPPRK